MATVQIRDIDDHLKEQGQKTLARMGMTLSGGFKMFLNQVVVTGKIPFEPTTVDENGFSPEYQKELWETIHDDNPDNWDGPFDTAEEMIHDLHQEVKKYEN